MDQERGGDREEQSSATTTMNAIIESLSLRNRAIASWVGDLPATLAAASSSVGIRPGSVSIVWLPSSDAGTDIATSKPNPGPD